MKKLYLILFLMCCCGYLMADQVLQIVKTDGQTHTINLNQEPVATYNDGNLIITTLTTTITYPLETVRKFVYFSGTEGIQNIKGEKFEISRDGKFLTFSGTEKDADAFMFTVSGQLLKRIHIPANTSTCLSLADMPFGVYIIKVDGVTYKIMNQ